ALPHRPRRAAARDGARADRAARQRGRPGAAQGARRRATGARAGRTHARGPGRRRRWCARRDRVRGRRRRDRPRTGPGVAMSGAATRSPVGGSAGMRQPTSTRMLADGLAAAAEAALTSRSVPVEVTVVELREHAHDLTNMLLTGVASPALQE